MITDTGVCIGGPLDQRRYVQVPPTDRFVIETDGKREKYHAERLGLFVYWRHESITSDQAVQRLLLAYGCKVNGVKHKVINDFF